jgi:hypothetical protein
MWSSVKVEIFGQKDWQHDCHVLLLCNLKFHVFWDVMPAWYVAPDILKDRSAFEMLSYTPSDAVTHHRGLESSAVLL